MPTPEAYHKYYNVISNPLLWFLQHYLWDTSRAPDIDEETWDAWENGYVTVNQLNLHPALNRGEEESRPPYGVFRVPLPRLLPLSEPRRPAETAVDAGPAPQGS